MPGKVSNPRKQRLEHHLPTTGTEVVLTCARNSTQLSKRAISTKKNLALVHGATVVGSILYNIEIVQLIRSKKEYYSVRQISSPPASASSQTPVPGRRDPLSTYEK